MIKEEDSAARARRDPVARVILRALHKQDMRTLKGQRGDIAGLAVVTSAQVRALLGDGT